MKRNLFVFLITLFIVIPLSVSAEEEVSIDCTKGLEDGSIQTANCTFGDITIPDDKNIDLGKYAIVIEFKNIGSAVEEDSIEVTQTAEFKKEVSDNTVTLTAKNGKEYKAGETLKIGKLSYSYDGGDVTENEECQLKANITFKELETDNPQTGVSLPMVAIGAAGLLAVGLYVSTKNKNKIYNV